MRIASETHAWQSFYLPLFIFAAISSALSWVSSNTLSESRSNALCRQRTAAAACAPSTTTDSRMGDVEMARMLIWF